MVLHPELGVGLDCVDVKRRVKTPTILKKVIAGQLDLENLGEELRVLYVAITRAKEKLILTGSRKCGAEKSAAAAQDAEGVLSYLERISAAGYLDWIVPALGVYGDRYPVQVVGAGQLAAEELKGRLADAFCREACMEQIRNADEALVRRIADRFSFCYPYQAQIARKNKYSVSELKHRAMREHFEREQEETVPVFAREDFSLEMIESRMISYSDSGDTDTPRGNFRVLGSGGVLVQFSGRGTAEEIWEMFCSMEDF